MNSGNEPSAPSHVPPGLIAHFDFHEGTAMFSDPWGAFQALNERPDIFYSLDLGGFWVITRKHLIEEVIANSELFSSAYSTIPNIDDDLRLIPPNLDPPHHAKYRALIAQIVFSAKAMANVEKDARAIARELIGAVRHKGTCDIMLEIARPLPIRVFLNLMGMPVERLDEFIHWVEVFFRGTSAKDVGTARLRVLEFVQKWIDSDPDKSGNRILAELKAAQVDGRPLTRDELSNIVLTLFMAGLDTVSAAIGHMLLFLATHPVHLQALVAEPKRIAVAVEEMLRRFGLANLVRVPRHDLEFHGVAMKKGDLVLCSMGIAGLDETASPRAEAVDFDRPNVRRHIAFGAGAHLCMGQLLARTEIRVLLEEVVPNLKRLRLKAGTAIEYKPGSVLTVRGIPAEWDL
jgi:cytochrome P450